jgi:hypothetical protein
MGVDNRNASGHSLKSKEMYNPDFVSFVDSRIMEQPLTRYFEKYAAY